MNEKAKDKDTISRARRDFIRDTALGGGSIMLAGSLGITQVSCSNGDKQVPVLSKPAPEEHIAACGLFCSNCRRFKSGKCEGCQVAPGYSNCAIRNCCIEKGITGCWQCDEFKAPADYKECEKIDNFMAKVFSLIFKSDRPAALAMLRDQGKEAFLKLKRESGKM